MKKTITFLLALSVAIAMNGCGLLWLMGSSDSQEESSSSEIETEAVTDTPTNQLSDLQIGDSVTIGGVTVTVNSIIDGEPSITGDTLEVNITYINNSNRLVSISPYDWSTLLHTGSDRAHVGGDNSFHLENISDGESWTGVVSLWKEDNAEKIKFESSSINLRLDNDVSATWVIPEELLGTEEVTDNETNSDNDEPNATNPISEETNEEVVDTTVMTEMTLSQENALKTALSYLDYTAFSYDGLVGQLEYEGYSHEDSVFAVDRCGADWNEQAAKMAQSYLDYTSFSRDGLIDQLVYEGFTQEQAEYGVSTVGY